MKNMLQRQKQREAREQAITDRNRAQRGENTARIKRLENQARQATAYAHQMAAAQQQRAAAEAAQREAQRKAAEEAARKRAAEEAKRKEQAAVDKRTERFATERDERKQKNAANNATNYWDEAQSIVQSSFGNSFGGGKDASKQSKYNVMGKTYDFSSVDGNQSASESAPNGNVEATGDNKPPNPQTFANNYKSKVLEDQRNKQANNPNSSSSFS